MTSYQNDLNVRRRATGGLAAFGCLFLLIAAGQQDPIVLVFAVAVAFVAYRNWVAGLFITESDVVIRNIVSTRRIARRNVVGVGFVTSRWSPTGWGYVRLEAEGGRSLRVTALRRDPLGGDSLSAAITRSLGLCRTGRELI